MVLIEAGDAANQPPVFVNREREITELRALASRGEPALALLYGRRRVGKTYLLDHAWPDRRVFYFLAGATTLEANRRELLRELASFVTDPSDADPQERPTWRSVFRLLADLATDAPLVVVLDEFQNLLLEDGSVASDLMAVWDREVRGRPLMLVACGSEVGTMAALESASGPLFGRWNWTARLKPFDYFNAARMLPGRDLRERTVAYGVLGGTPRYLATVRPNDDLQARLTEAVLSPRGEVHVQLDRLIDQEQGIRDAAEYRAVLTAIAGGATTLQAIANVTGRQDRVHTVRRTAGILEDLGWVRHETNFAAHPRATVRYRISDPALRFWYRFVYPNRSRLERGDAAAVWASEVQPNLNTFMGAAFEDVTRQALTRIEERLGLPPVKHAARWEGRARSGRSVELDLVAELSDHRMLTGEVKWSSRPVGAKVHVQHLRKLDDLAGSGQGWARDALDVTRGAGFLYVSAAGFDSAMHAVAGEDPRVQLLDLADLYEGLQD